MSPSVAPSNKFLFIYVSFVHQAFILFLIFTCTLLNIIACFIGCLVRRSSTRHRTSNPDVTHHSRSLSVNGRSTSSACPVNLTPSEDENPLMLNLMLIGLNVNDWSYGFTLALFILPNQISYIFVLKALKICQVLTHALNLPFFLLFHVRFRHAVWHLIRKLVDLVRLKCRSTNSAVEYLSPSVTAESQRLNEQGK